MEGGSVVLEWPSRGGGPSVLFGPPAPHPAHHCLESFLLHRSSEHTCLVLEPMDALGAVTAVSPPHALACRESLFPSCPWGLAKWFRALCLPPGISLCPVTGTLQTGTPDTEVVFPTPLSSCWPLAFPPHAVCARAPPDCHCTSRTFHPQGV